MPLSKQNKRRDHEEDAKSLKVMYLKTNLTESVQDLLIEHVDGNYYTIPDLPKLTLSQKIKMIRAELEQSRAIREKMRQPKTIRVFKDGEGDEIQELTTTDRFAANIETLKRFSKDMERLKRIYSSVMKKLNNLYATCVTQS